MNLLKSIITAIVVFTILLFAAKINWPFQFAVCCFTYQIVKITNLLLKAKNNIHIMALPFHFVYLFFNLYDYFVQFELFNSYVFLMPISAIISFVVYKWKIMNIKKFLDTIKIPIYFLIFYCLYAELMVLINFNENTYYIQSNAHVLHKNKIMYYWSTTCYPCIKSIPKIAPLVKDSTLVAICLVENLNDSMRAIEICDKHTFQSLIQMNNSKSNIRLFPTWIIEGERNKYHGSIPQFDPIGYKFNLWLWKLLYD